MLAAATIWIASLGLLFGLLVLLYLDHRYRLFAFGSTNDIDHWLRWTMTPPQVFAWAIPVLGFAGDVAPVFGRNRPRRYGMALAAIGAFAAFSFGAWTYLGSVDHQVIYQQFLLRGLVLRDRVDPTTSWRRSSTSSPRRRARR